MLVLGLLVIVLIVLGGLHLIVPNGTVRLVLTIAISVALGAVPTMHTMLLALLLVVIEFVISYATGQLNWIKKMNGRHDG